MRKARLGFLSVLIVACLVISPVKVSSQCNIINTNVSNQTTIIFVTKTLNAAANCRTTTAMAQNAFSCFPAAAYFNTAMLYAVALSATVGPFCNWSCACGVGAPPDVTTDGNDGLPVELMDFAVEEGTS